jgi:hypothetical protein
VTLGAVEHAAGGGVVGDLFEGGNTNTSGLRGTRTRQVSTLTPTAPPAGERLTG